MNNINLDNNIRRVPDYPKKGITFYDITSILEEPKIVHYILDCLHAKIKDRPTSLVALEARGFLFATGLASRLGIPVYLARKPGKLPGTVVTQQYNLEYGTDSIEMQVLDLPKLGSQCLILDDLLATGGTVKAVVDLIHENSKSKVTQVAAIIDLPFLGYKEKLKDIPNIFSIQTYNGE